MTTVCKDCGIKNMGVHHCEQFAAVPYRTPACDKHLSNNDDPICPWCHIEKLEAEVADLREYRQATEHFVGAHKLDLRDFCNKLDAIDARNRGDSAAGEVKNHE